MPAFFIAQVIFTPNYAKITPAQKFCHTHCVLNYFRDNPMNAASTSNHHAVFFLSDHKVSRQMLFSEFEAMLDGYAGLSDMVDTEAHCVYVVINPQLKIEGLVFFLIYFDEEGRADADWNIPLEKLLKASGKGPNLGAGPISLACRSQCAINWHQKELWDPEMAEGRNDFLAIRRAVEQNRLHLAKSEEEAVIPLLSAKSKTESFLDHSALDLDDDEVVEHLEAAERLKLARQLRDQELQIRTLASQREKALEDASHQYRVEIHAQKAQLQNLRETCERLRLANEQLQEKLLQRNQQYLNLQEKVSGQSDMFRVLEEKLKKAKSAEKESLLRQKCEAEVAMLKQHLDELEESLLHQKEKYDELESELSDTQAMLRECQEKSVLNKLKKLEVVFVAYHPGAGHVTVPFSDVKRYTDNPVAYVAGKCFVTEEVYRAWLEHQENPVCTHLARKGEPCLAPVTKVNAPGDFELGVSDRCSIHRHLA